MEQYRVFLSSPADVLTERDRAEAAIKRINSERVDQPQFNLIRWELEYYGATSDFQAQIPKPSECQLVVCIFWKRLGSELPEKYMRTDGTIPTGTEYEFEDAMWTAAERPDKLPDVLVYRKTAEVKFSVDTLELERAQYEHFMAFWQRWFRNEKGHFVAGFQSFVTPDELEPFDVEHARSSSAVRGKLNARGPGSSPRRWAANRSYSLRGRRARESRRSPGPVSSRASPNSGA